MRPASGLNELIILCFRFDSSQGRGAFDTVIGVGQVIKGQSGLSLALYPIPPTTVVLHLERHGFDGLGADRY